MGLAMVSRNSRENTLAQYCLEFAPTPIGRARLQKLLLSFTEKNEAFFIEDTGIEIYVRDVVSTATSGINTLRSAFSLAVGKNRDAHISIHRITVTHANVLQDGRGVGRIRR